jgi:adenosylmethionine-8-amino-7-oxononanoate aminotransferase
VGAENLSCGERQDRKRCLNVYSHLMSVKVGHGGRRVAEAIARQATRSNT